MVKIIERHLSLEYRKMVHPGAREKQVGHMRGPNKFENQTEEINSTVNETSRDMKI